MSWLDECEQEAKALTQEKRQEFLNHIWAGRTLGKARELAGVTFDAANGIMRMNIKDMKYLKRVTE